MGDEDGKKMSLYGSRDLNPEEAAGQWKERIQREDRLHENHIAIKGNGTDTWPGQKQYTAEELQSRPSYFGKTEKPEESSSIFEHMFHIKYDYNSKLHRDDRQHTVGLDIQAEELQRRVPVRSSTEYGRYAHRPLEQPSRCHVRVDKVLGKEFKRTRGTGLPTPSHMCKY